MTQLYGVPDHNVSESVQVQFIIIQVEKMEFL